MNKYKISLYFIFINQFFFNYNPELFSLAAPVEIIFIQKLFF